MKIKDFLTENCIDYNKNFNVFIDKDGNHIKDNELNLLILKIKKDCNLGEYNDKQIINELKIIIKEINKEKAKQEKEQQRIKQQQEKEQQRIERQQEKESNKFSKETFLEDKPEWYKYLIFNSDGIRNCQTNAEIFLEQSSKYKDRFYYEEFNGKYIFVDPKEGERQIQWRKDLPDIQSDLEKELGFNNRFFLESAIITVCNKHKRNTIINEIEKLVWDGNKRIENYFVKLLGAKDEDLTHTITRNFFYSMMNRLYHPGCPISSCPILQDSLQGSGKSLIFKYLFEWLEDLTGIKLVEVMQGNEIYNEKDLVGKMIGTLIMVLDECNVLIKSEDSWMKSFITQSRDKIRLPYEKDTLTYNRGCVFIANTNDQNILKDYTGQPDELQRRWLIVECNGTVRSSEEWEKIYDLEYKKQILAEAVYFYKNNPNYNYLTLSKEDTNKMIEIQSRHKTLNENDVIMSDLQMYLDAKIYNKSNITGEPEDIKMILARIKEYNNSFDGFFISGTQIDIIDRTSLKQIAQKFCNFKQSSQKLTHIMNCLGWEQKQTTVDKRTGRYFVRKSAEEIKLF